MNSPLFGRKLGSRAAGRSFPRRHARFEEGGEVEVIRPMEADPEDVALFAPMAAMVRATGPFGEPIIDVENADEFEAMRAALAGQARSRDHDSMPSMRSAPIRMYRRGGRTHKLPGYFFGGSSSPQQSYSNTTTSVDPGGGYYPLMQDVFNKARTLANTPYQAYEGVGVAPLTGDQNQAFANIRANQGNWSPFFNRAQSELANSSGYDPTQAGMPFINQAGAMQTGTEAASPFTAAASRTFPEAVDEYMSPYTDAVVNRIADLGNRNLMENILPKVNDTFTGGSAAQFGRERHADITGRAIRDTQESILGQQSEALERGYGTAGSLFGADANRAAGLVGTTGNLANQDRSTTAGLGTAAAGITGQGAATDIAQAQTQTGLGQSTQGAALTDANALGSSGQQQQQHAQNVENWNYGQWQAQQQDPYNKLSWARDVASGWQLPGQTQGTQTTYGAQKSGSPFGQILGAATSLIGAAGGFPAIGSMVGGLFGGMSGSGTQYAAGGQIPAVKQMRRAMQMRGTMPAGMPGMPPIPTLAPQRPMGQPNGQPATPFARGGSVTNRRQISPIAAVHKHERDMHGSTMAELTKFARGGPFGGYRMEAC